MQRALIAIVVTLTACGGGAKTPAPAEVPATATALPLSIPCRDAREDVYATSAPAALAKGDHGRILACARTGARTLVVSYATERVAGQPGASTAQVTLPAPSTRPMRWAVVAHGTIGLADRCAPSRQNGAFVNEMALPLVERGYAVIATDYAGLGNGRGRTVQGWGIAEDQAHSVLDAGRALRRLLGPGALTEQGALVGHSQGGGAVLAAQAFAKRYAPELPLAAVVAFAPGWYDARIFLRMLAAPSEKVGGSPERELLSAFAAMWFFGHAAVYDGMARATEPFAAGVRKAVRAAVRRRCVLALGKALSVVAARNGDLYDPAFVARLPEDEAWLARASADRPALEPTGAPVLIVQGLQDLIVTGSAARCTADRMAAESVTTTVCTDEVADHFTVLERMAPTAERFIDAALRGQPPPSCTRALPACVPVTDLYAPR